MASVTERDRDVDRHRKRRASAKTVLVPPCADRKRREELELNDEKWLRFYCGDLFWYEFTDQQRAMIEAIHVAIVYGGDQALAASRGEGKTKLFERMLLKYSLAGAIKFSVLFAATATASQDSLQSMRDEVEQNELLLADYPEVCVPVRALEDTPNRAHYQLVSGNRHDNGEPYAGASSRFTWCGHEIIFPNVPGSPAAWGVIATRGLDGAVRGLNKKNRRPEVVGIDDPDTEETVSNPEQAKKLEKRIDRGIAGLGGQQRGVARVMLTTLQTKECVSAWYTDPQRKPSFKGKRFRFLIKRPAHEDLWERYVSYRIEDQQSLDDGGRQSDPFARRAHRFYLDNRTKMDEGAVVANPHRFDGSILPDGSQLEVSALQRYFNEVARIGQPAVSTEYDNDPPDDNELDGAQITQRIVASRISELEHREIPAGIEKLVAFMDVGNNVCHFTETAWHAQEIGDITDYGTFDVRRTTDQKALELELLRVFHEWRIDLLHKYSIDGQTRHPDLVLIDSGDGHHTNAVYQFCREAGHPFYPSKGMSDSWTPPRICLLRGDHWSFVRQRDEAKTKLYEFNQLFWMQRLHQRFMTPTFDEAKAKEGIRERIAGSLAIYSCPDSAESLKKRREFTHQIVGEVWGLKKMNQMGRIVHGKNHFEDSTLGCCVAGNIVGSMILPTGKASRVDPKNRPTPQQMLRRA